MSEHPAALPFIEFEDKHKAQTAVHPDLATLPDPLSPNQKNGARKPEALRPPHVVHVAAAPVVRGRIMLQNKWIRRFGAAQSNSDWI